MVKWHRDPSLRIAVDPEPWGVPNDLASAINGYWDQTVTVANPSLFRGPVLAVRTIEPGCSPAIYTVFTDYAHYLYSRDHLAWDHPHRVRVIFAAACLLTADGYLLAARMGRNTTRPGWIQAVGGSAVRDDVLDGFFEPVRSVRREVAEETGLDLDGGDVRGVSVAGWTLDANGSVSVAVRIDLDASAAAAITMIEYHLRRVRRAGVVPELAEVVAIPLGRKGLQWLKRQPVSQGRYLRGYLTAPELQRF